MGMRWAIWEPYGGHADAVWDRADALWNRVYAVWDHADAVQVMRMPCGTYGTRTRPYEAIRSRIYGAVCMVRVPYTALYGICMALYSPRMAVWPIGHHTMAVRVGPVGPLRHLHGPYTVSCGSCMAFALRPRRVFSAIHHRSLNSEFCVFPRPGSGIYNLAEPGGFYAVALKSINKTR